MREQIAGDRGQLFFMHDKFLQGIKSTVYPNAPAGVFYPGDPGYPGRSGIYKQWAHFAPRLGLNWSPGSRDGWLAKVTGGPGKTSIGMGYGIFYNPIEQLVLEQFSAEPPFGGSESIFANFLQTPFVDQTGGVHPNPFTGVLSPPRGQPIDWNRNGKIDKMPVYGLLSDWPSP